MSVEGVSLHQADVASQVALGMLSSPVARVIKQGRQRIAAAKRPVIADTGPDPADHSNPPYISTRIA